jgi:hypothetical protein
MSGEVGVYPAFPPTTEVYRGPPQWARGNFCRPFLSFSGPVDCRKKDQKSMLTGQKAWAYTPRLIANGAADKAGTDAADKPGESPLSAGCLTL